MSNVQGMARPLRIEQPDTCYHVLSRGIELRSIFTTDKDYEMRAKAYGQNNKKQKKLVARTINDLI